MPAGHTIIIGDCHKMLEIKSSSVQLIVTSPPYFNIHSPEAGLNYLTNLEAYLREMRDVFKECRRVLQKGRYICINMNDISSDREKLLIPAHIIFSMKKAGFDYQEDILWSATPKINIPKLQAQINPLAKSTPNPEVSINDFERTMVFRKGKASPIRFPHRKKKYSELEALETLASWNNAICDAWEDSKGNTYANALSEELVEALILKYSREGETILDPFLGNGITPKVAARHNRNSIGYESNPYNLRIIRRNAGILDDCLKVVFQGEGRLT